MNNGNNQGAVEIDVLKLIRVLLKKWYVLFVSAVVGAGLFLGYTVLYITPLYQADVLLYVNNSSISVGSKSISISGSDLSTAKTLVDTYCIILKTRLTLESVITEAGLDYSYETLYDMVSAEAVNETEVFRVTVTDSDPVEACNIANTIAKVLPEKIASVLDGSSVRTVDMAVVPVNRVSPSYSKNTAIGIFAGILISAAVIVAMELMNDAIGSETWLSENFGESIPILSVIPNSEEAAVAYKSYKNKYYYSYGSYGKASSDNKNEDKRRKA